LQNQYRFRAVVIVIYSLLYYALNTTTQQYAYLSPNSTTIL
jgi:hypothetical protein